MLEFISGIVSTVSEGIRSLAAQRALGEKTGSIGCGGDETKTADAWSEDTVEKLVLQYLDLHQGERIIVISEESGIRSYGDPASADGFLLVIDPLDGSNNLRPWRTPAPAVAVSVAGAPLSSLAVRKNFELFEVGVVADVFGKRIFSGQRGMGAGEASFGRISASPETDLQKAILGVDLDCMGSEYESLALRLAPLLTNSKCQRRLGSSILDFMKVASGEYDSFVSLGGRMKLHDLAAASLIVREAGGVFEIDGLRPDCLVAEIVKTGDGLLINRNRFRVVASGNPEIHQKVKALLP